MVPGFSNTISLPMTTWRRGTAACHVRSASLPCELHPLVANLQQQIGTVRSWAASADASVATIKACLSQIELLVSSVNDFLNLTERRTALQHAAASTDCLLENFLCLIDSYGSLLSDIAALKQHQFEAQSALRRHDSTLFSSSLKSQKRIEKDLSRRMVSLRSTTKYPSLLHASAHAPETEIFSVLKEATGAISAASVVLYNRVVAMSAAASTTATSSALGTVRPFKKKIYNAEIEMLICVKFEELEESFRIAESGSERLFRSLVNCRVALLNIQSNSF